MSMFQASCPHVSGPPPPTNVPQPNPKPLLLATLLMCVFLGLALLFKDCQLGTTLVLHNCGSEIGFLNGHTPNAAQPETVETMSGAGQK